MSSDESPERGLQSWVDRIRDKDMPVFGHTVNAVRTITADEMASAGALARVILQDAALTTKVLKIANSAFFNPARQPVSTVSRAIVVLGFDVVGDIVLSIALIDAFLSGGLRGRVVKEMARCFHAAVHARTAAASKGVAESEEVFIAALLGRVGEMAFWCFGGKAAALLDEVIRDQPDEKPENLQMDILGFRLRNLTAALAREWRLGPMVVAAAEPGTEGSISEQAIVQGYRVATATEEGWDSPEARKAIAAYADFVGKPVKDVGEQLSRNAAEAARVAAQFGAEAAAREIPLPEAASGVDIEAEAADPAPDAMLQLKILRDLSLLLASKPSLNDVLQLVLEGIYRGLGMSHAVFALQTSDRQHVIGKAALGRDSEQMLHRFQFNLDNLQGEVVNELFLKARPLWLKYPPEPGVRTERLQRVAGAVEAFLAPIVASGRVIGFFYADRNGAPGDEEAWQGFQHFAQQASLCFEHVASRGRKH